MVQVNVPQPEPTPLSRVLINTLIVLSLLFLFLVGIKGLGSGFKLLGKDLLKTFFEATENPFVGLVVGILGTTLVQSSSVTTSMIVGLVAAPDNPLPVINAVPMIMGANIGTTVTNSIVAMAHMSRRDEFVRAFSTATCHDFFNFITVLVLLPVEMMTGFLSKAAAAISDGLIGVGGVKYKSPLKTAVSAGFEPIKATAKGLFESTGGQSVFLIAISSIIIFFTLFLIVKVMRRALSTRVEVYLTRVLGKNAVVSMVVGVVVTVMVQSSSITTSLLVPLAGAGLITLSQAFPITLGANIGTTVTALLASMAVSGANAQFGVQIALVHLFFNLVGILLVYPVATIRDVPLKLARGLADIAVNSRKWAIIYVMALFYGLPALLIFLSKVLGA